MGQILGLGFSGGEKTKGSTTPQVPDELKRLYGQISDVAGSNVGGFKSLIGRAMGGDRGATTGFVNPALAKHAGTFEATAPALSAYAPTFESMAPTFESKAATFRPVADTFQPMAPAYTAPMMAKLQQTIAQIRRSMPRGAAQDAAIARAMQEGNITAGAAQGQVAAQDVATKMGLAGEDVRTRMGLEGQDVATRMGLAGQDVATRMGLAGRDVDTRNAAIAHDIATRMGLAGKDVEGENAMRGREDEFMQGIMKLYASILGGFNPAAQIGSKQTQTQSGALGLPFASVPLG